MSDLNHLQKEIDHFIKNHGGYWELPWLTIALMEELGELSKILQLYAGIRPKMNEDLIHKKALEEEIGDVAFALICLANYLKIDLSQAILKTLEKYQKRES